MIELIKRLMALLSAEKIANSVEDASFEGLSLGLSTASADLGIHTTVPDEIAITRIGVRAKALSERTISKARGDLAFNADKLQLELDAAIKSGMSEVEALKQIQGRVKSLFTDSLKDWELQRLVRDQFLVATKEGRRLGWEQGGVQWRQWRAHRDSKTGEDSKRMDGQITGINEPYTDPKTGEKYMLPHIRPNDRCYEIPLFKLPKTSVERDGLTYAKGGPGSGIKGHKTAKQLSESRERYKDVPEGVGKVLLRYEYMEHLNEHQLEAFRKERLSSSEEALEFYKDRVLDYEVSYDMADEDEEKEAKAELDAHKKVVEDIEGVIKLLEEAFSSGEKKIAIDKTISIAHTAGKYAILGEKGGKDRKKTEGRITKHLNYIRDQTVHKEGAS